MNRIKTLRFTSSSGSWTAPPGVTQCFVSAYDTSNLTGPPEVPVTVVPNTSYAVNVTTTSVFGALLSYVKTINYIDVSWVE